VHFIKKHHTWVAYSLSYIRKNEKDVAALSDIIELDNEMIEFEFEKLRASNTLNLTCCQAFIMSSPDLHEHGSIIAIFANCL
jgi:hypothetical protein